MIWLTNIYIAAPQLFNLTRLVYNNLTSIYNAVFKTTSPLTLDWRSEEISKLLGNDTELICLFCNVKTEIFWFRKVIVSL